MKHTLLKWNGLLLLLFVATGCRTYGGYDSEEAALAQIEQANTQFAASLERARAAAEALKATAPAHPEWGDAVADYEALVEEHARTLAAHHALQATLAEEGGSYRTVSRALGAIVSEERRINDGYEQVLDRMAGAPESLRRVYQVVPPYYHRVMHQKQRPTVNALTSVN